MAPQVRTVTIVVADHTPASRWRRSDLRLRWPIALFLIGAWLLDVQLPFEEVNVGNLLLMAGALAACAVTFWTRRRTAIRGVTIMGHDVIYAVYLGYAAITAIWAPSALETVVHVSYLAIVWFTALNLADGDARFAVRLTVVLAVITALVSFALVPVSPAVAFQPATSTDLPELRGIFSHQLRLGLLMAIGIGFLALGWTNGLYPKRLVSRSWAATAGLVLSVCLVAAFARLYSAAMLLALTLTLAISKPGWKRGGAAAAAAVCAAVIALSLDYLAEILSNLDADVTLTGRTVIWARTVGLVGGTEWFGFGYASFDHPQFDWTWPFYRPAHPHNSFLQAYFETGYIGLALTVALVISHFRIALRVSRATGGYAYSLFLVLLTAIGSLTGSNYAGKPTFLFSLLLLLIAIESREVRQSVRERRAAAREARALTGTY